MLAVKSTGMFYSVCFFLLLLLLLFCFVFVFLFVFFFVLFFPEKNGFDISYKLSLFSRKKKKIYFMQNFYEISNFTVSSSSSSNGK